jgi:hypothetical protein
MNLRTVIIWVVAFCLMVDVQVSEGNAASILSLDEDRGSMFPKILVPSY